jgi:transposase
MANTRIIEMTIQQIIRLRESGYSLRRIAKELGLHRLTVTNYLALYRESGASVEEILDPDKNVQQLLNIQLEKQTDSEKAGHLTSFLEGQFLNQNKPGFTIQNLYQDYVAEGGSYSRSQFYRLVKEKWHPPGGSLKIDHKYGEQLFVDYTGKKLYYTDKETGEEIDVEVLVTILPNSQYLYVEAMSDQKQHNFVRGIINALEFIDGAPKGIVSDNLKSAVTKGGKYQSVINKTLQGMALHYKTSIDPTRPYHPKDKAMVEGAVKIVYQQIFYHVSKHRHFSIAELNISIKQYLEELNNRPLSKIGRSRKDQFLEEKPYLFPLPMYRYELKEYRRAKVQKMGYVYCNEYKNYYSVPHRYIGKRVELRFDSRTLEVYYGGARIANHITSQSKGAYVTNKEHLSSNNKAYTEWTPEYFSKMAAEKGEHIQEYITLLIDQKPYPEQAYRQAQGILALCRLYETSRVNAACQMALDYSKSSYNIIKQILENERDKNYQRNENELIIEVPVHENIRGSQYYT